MISTQHGNRVSTLTGDRLNSLYNTEETWRNIPLQAASRNAAGSMNGATTHHNENGNISASAVAASNTTANAQPRQCVKCRLPMSGKYLNVVKLTSGQFVRALGGTYHIDCFRCLDCDKTVASKFFPIEDKNTQYPLCETDYFRRLKLLCHNCGGALRGSYITALEKKFHIEHFTCSICPSVFGPHDSYYEHDNNVYCHYHFSLQFAQKCYGCQSSILKQFVEIQRNGVNQHWHPECYMIQKFWNVKLAARTDDENVPREIETLTAEEVRKRETVMEEKVNTIWSVLSGFEESSAACISDMLLNVSNGAYVDGVLAAVKFIAHVEVLFAALDQLELALVQCNGQGLPFSREAKMLCKKIISFFQLLSKTQEVGVRKLGITQELLSLVTGLAHYLKLLIRISLTGSLKLERERGNTTVVNDYLRRLGSINRESEPSLPVVPEAAPSSQGICHACGKTLEEECVRTGDIRIHLSCLRCKHCNKELGREYSDAHFNKTSNHITCASCARPGSQEGFAYITKLTQYVFLLKAALTKLYGTLKQSTKLPHTSDDPNLESYDSTQGHTLDKPVLLRSTSRSKSYSAESEQEQDRSKGYATTLNDIRRLRSTHMPKNMQSKARTSRILDPEDLANDSEAAKQAQESKPQEQANGALHHDRKITFDDLNRLVASEQSKQKRPLSFLRKTRNKSPGKGSNGSSKLVKDMQLDRMANESSLSLHTRGKTYLSELSALEIFIVRHIAVISLEPLVREHFNMEELLDLIETRKGGFWGKFGKAFKPPTKEKDKKDRKKGVFGVSLDVLVERSSSESTLGVGPQPLKVPSFIDDLIIAMKDMDMSVEGVFRKNGNIRRLKDLADAIDKNQAVANLSEENAVQLAALLKKFLRDLPDPLMTFKLHKLFVAAQKFEEEDVRYRVMHLTCCLLPRAHRDTMEVVFTFLTWVAQFAHVDEEQGSKMDEHNLATVITPNVLYSKNKDTVMDESFAAIETVHSLIKYSEEFCCVPEDLMMILQDTNLFSGSADLTTKDILKRCEDKLGSRTASSSHTVEAITRRPGDRPKPPTRVDTDADQVYASRNELSVREQDYRNTSTTSLPLQAFSPTRKKKEGQRSVSDKDAERIMKY